MKAGDLVQWKAMRTLDDNEAAAWSSDWANAADFNSPNVEIKTGVVLQEWGPGRVKVLRDDGVVVSQAVGTLSKIKEK